MTPTPILSALLREWIPLGNLRAIARAAGLKASTLRDQYWGSSRPTPETFLAVGKAQARPAAEVSLAVVMAAGDEHAVEVWRADQGPPEGRAVAVLRALGMEREAVVLEADALGAKLIRERKAYGYDGSGEGGQGL